MVIKRVPKVNHCSQRDFPQVTSLDRHFDTDSMGFSFIGFSNCDLSVRIILSEDVHGGIKIPRNRLIHIILYLAFMIRNWDVYF